MSSKKILGKYNRGTLVATPKPHTIPAIIMYFSEFFLKNKNIGKKAHDKIAWAIESLELKTPWANSLGCSKRNIVQIKAMLADFRIDFKNKKNK